MEDKKQDTKNKKFKKEKQKELKPVFFDKNVENFFLQKLQKVKLKISIKQKIFYEGRKILSKQKRLTKRQKNKLYV